MRRGEICLVDLEPVRGAEANKQRPAVVVPVTSSIERVYPFQVELSAAATGLPANSKAHAEQVRSISVERVGRRVGIMTADSQSALDDALRLHLAL